MKAVMVCTLNIESQNIIHLPILSVRTITEPPFDMGPRFDKLIIVGSGSILHQTL